MLHMFKLYSNIGKNDSVISRTEATVDGKCETKSFSGYLPQNVPNVIYGHYQMTLFNPEF